MVNLRKQFGEVRERISAALTLPAAATSLPNYAAYEDFIAPLGLGWWGAFLALCFAVVVGVMYWLYYSVLLDVVAFMPKVDRAKLTPLILGMTVVMLAISAYPNALIMGGGSAVEYADATYVEDAAGRGDAIKENVRKFDQLSGVIAGGAKTLRDLEEREKRGLLSGFESETARPGPVSDWIGALAVRFEGLAAEITAAQGKATQIITRIDKATDAMRGALKDKKADSEVRRSAMQSASDGFRTAAIELKEILPIAAVSSFASGLQGEQVRPALSGNERIRGGQLKAVETVEATLKQHGTEISTVLTTLAGDRGNLSIPPYAPEPATVLVIKHAHKLVSVIVSAVLLDTLPLVLYWIIARVNDGLRRTRLQDDDLESMSVGEMVRALRAEQHLKGQRARADYGLIDGPYASYLKRKDDGEALS